MIEFIIGFIIFEVVGIPMLGYLLLTIRGKRDIRKKELYISWMAGSAFLAWIIVRLSLESGTTAVSPFAIFFVILAVAETVVFRKRAKAQKQQGLI